MTVTFRNFTFNISLFYFILMGSHSSYAQVVTYYPWQSQLAISSNLHKTAWIEARFQTNSFLSSLNTEVAPMFNFVKKENVNYYTGVGIQFNALNSLANKNILNGYFLSIGTRIRPLEKNRRVALSFEISPYVERKFDLGTFRTWLGVSYEFGRK
jgi:hypothetical protein